MDWKSAQIKLVQLYLRSCRLHIKVQCASNLESSHFKQKVQRISIDCICRLNQILNRFSREVEIRKLPEDKKHFQLKNNFLAHLFYSWYLRLQSLEKRDCGRFFLQFLLLFFQWNEIQFCAPWTPSVWCSRGLNFHRGTTLNLNLRLVYATHLYRVSRD